MAGHARPGLVRTNQTKNRRENAFIRLSKSRGEDAGKGTVESAVRQVYRADKGLQNKVSQTTAKVLKGVRTLRQGGILDVGIDGPRKTEIKEFYRISSFINDAGTALLEREIALPDPQRNREGRESVTTSLVTRKTRLDQGIGCSDSFRVHGNVCSVKGCDKLPEGAHLIPVAKGGQYGYTDIIPLCEKHHGWHEHGAFLIDPHTTALRINPNLLKLEGSLMKLDLKNLDPDKIKKSNEIRT